MTTEAPIRYRYNLTFACDPEAHDRLSELLTECVTVPGIVTERFEQVCLRPAEPFADVSPETTDAK